MRKFEVVKDEHIKYDNFDIKLPVRSTINAAGYDLFSPVDIVIPAGKVKTVWTNVKGACNPDEFIMICVRSSMGKKGISLANDVGIVDSDYYSNTSNDGNIGVMLRNNTTEDFNISVGDKIAQAIFMKYLIADNDNVVSNVRTGGMGSTGK